MMTKKPVLPFVETMITYGCNLSCQGCTNYSDYNVKGLVTWDQGKRWIEGWLEKIEIPDFGIMGGEPLMNPEVERWILGCRDVMPTSQIRFTTNAILLSRRRSVLDTLMSIGNCVIKISAHQPQEFYTQEAMKLLFDLSDWRPVVEHGIHRWINDDGVRLQINFPKNFVKSYLGEFSNMLPHHNDPAQAFDICVQQRCPLLYQGRLYKCSTSALLGKVLGDWNRSHVPEWQSYLSYRGIGVDCDDQDLENFIGDFGRPEWICQMCPSIDDKQSQVDHQSTVIPKSQWIHLHVKNTSVSD